MEVRREPGRAVVVGPVPLDRVGVEALGAERVPATPRRVLAGGRQLERRVGDGLLEQRDRPRVRVGRGEVGVVRGGGRARPALLPPGPRERAEHLVGIAGAVGDQARADGVRRPGRHEVGPARRRRHRVGGRRAWSPRRRGPRRPRRRQRRGTTSTGSPYRIVRGSRSARASTLAASHARRAEPAPDQIAGSMTNRAVVGPSSRAESSAGLSRMRRSRRNHMTEGMPLNVTAR